MERRICFYTSGLEISSSFRFIITETSEFPAYPTMQAFSQKPLSKGPKRGIHTRLSTVMIQAMMITFQKEGSWIKP